MARVKAKKDKPKHTKATVTPLVRGIFDSIFQGQIDEETAKSKRQRCGICEVHYFYYFLCRFPSVGGTRS